MISSPASEASSVLRPTCGSRNAIVTSSSLRVSFERDDDAVAPAGVPNTIAVAIVAFARDHRPIDDLRARRRHVGRGPEPARPPLGVARPASSQPPRARPNVPDRAPLSNASRRAARSRDGRNDLAGAGRAGPAAALAERADPGRIGRPEPRRPAPEHEVEVVRRLVVGAVLRRPPRRGPLMSSAGISIRNRDGSAIQLVPGPRRVARCQACDRYRRVRARVMPT